MVINVLLAKDEIFEGKIHDLQRKATADHQSEGKTTEVAL